MTGALLILAVTAAIGLVLWLWEHSRSERHGPSLHHSHTKEESGGVCCGMHAICEKTMQADALPVYYDDEELDRFAGRAEDEYSDAETEEFRDVLLTLSPPDAPGWAMSLKQRNIALPSPLKAELDLLLTEI